MSLTESNMMELGTVAPSFILPDTISGHGVSLESIHSEIATVIVFSCNHCPYVIHINDKLVEIAKTYQERGIAFVAISSNDVINYPQDSPEKMKKLAEEVGYPFPYLYDETQEVAHNYHAACTPDFYVFDGKLELAYRGRFCPSRPGSELAVTGADLTDALDALIEKRPVSEKQYPSAGCNIKWK
jgi:peroxiredoxin